VLGSDWLNNIITTAIEIKENTAKVMVNGFLMIKEGKQ
jgi:hypothetical protein